MHKTFTLLGLCLWSCFLSAQTPNHVPGQLLLQLQPNTDATLWTQNKLEKKMQLAYYCIQAFVPVASALNIWKIQFDPDCIHNATTTRRLATATSQRQALGTLSAQR